MIISLPLPNSSSSVRGSLSVSNGPYIQRFNEATWISVLAYAESGINSSCNWLPLYLPLNDPNPDKLSEIDVLPTDMNGDGCV